MKGAQALGFAVALLSLAVSTSAAAAVQGSGPVAVEQAALLVIDIQNFYFEGGRVPLVGSVEAGLKARRVLDAFRTANRPVIHIRHMPKQPPAKPDTQYDIHSSVDPRAGETVLIKHYANAFRETDLAARLQALGVRTLVVCGMQTQMCVEAAVRHAADLGYEVVLVGDACATRDLSYGGTTVPARQVHAAVLAALSGTYAKVVAAETFK